MDWLTNNSTDPYFNMAFDEFCLEHLPPGRSFFYLWRNRPSVILGFNQCVEQEVNLEYASAQGILLVRRITGGGAVYHDLNNMNYTFVGPLHPEDSEFGPGQASVIAEALRELGVAAELSGRNDIFVEGRKISGYARRIWKDREIVHGTLMYDVDIDTLTRVLDVPGTSKLALKGVASVRSRVTNLKDYLPQFASLDEFQEALQKKLAADDGNEFLLTASQLDEIRQLAEGKFATREWIFGKGL